MNPDSHEKRESIRKAGFKGGWNPLAFGTGFATDRAVVGAVAAESQYLIGISTEKDLSDRTMVTFRIVKWDLRSIRHNSPRNAIEISVPALTIRFAGMVLHFGPAMKSLLHASTTAPQWHVGASCLVSAQTPGMSGVASLD